MRGLRSPYTVTPEAWELAREGGPIFPLRKGRQVVFGPPRYSAADAIA